jgi:hypothetical protein
MRNIVIGFVFAAMILLSVNIVSTMNSRSTRSQELSDALDTALEGTLSTLSKGTYDINNTDEYIADLVSNIAGQIQSDSELTVNILDADIEKGIMTVQVKEEYKHINGKTGAVTASKTVLLEEQQTTEDAEITDTVTINFYLPDNTLYKSYKVKKGTEISEPVAPSENIEWLENGVKVSFPLRSEENKIINAIYK